MKPAKPPAAALKTAITDAARFAFTELRAAHPSETFYTYALYTSNDGDYVTPTANTEEALRRVAGKHTGGPGGAEEDFAGLRWSPCDWEYHLAGQHHFDDAQVLLNARPRPDDFDQAEAEVTARLKIFTEALKALDQEGFFGTGKERAKVVLLIMMGDQDTKLLLDGAKKLNPAGVYKRFAEPFLVRKVGRFQHIGSRNVYEMHGPAFSADGRIIAAAGDATVLAWTFPEYKEVLRKRYQHISVWDVAISPDGATIALGFGSAIGKGNGGFQFWNVAKKSLDSEFDGARDVVLAVTFSPDGKTFASAGGDGIIRLWDMESGGLRRQINSHNTGVFCLRFSSDSQRLYASGREECIRIWDPATGENLGEIPDAGDQFALSPDEKHLVIAPGYGARQTVARIWDLGRRELIREIDINTSQLTAGVEHPFLLRVSAATFSPDARLVALGTAFSGFGSLWDWQANREVLVLDPGGYQSFSNLVFLPDGKSIALTGRGFNSPPLVIWDISEVNQG